MLNTAILLKIQERLNKLASADYDNIEPWQSIEAFNKGMSDWTRRNLHGLNVVKEGDEQSTRRIDDFQCLLEPMNMIMSNKGTYYETNDLPANYMQWKRISCNASNDCCPGKRSMRIYPAEEGNIDVIMADLNKKPSFEWAETFATIAGNKVKIFTDGEFVVEDAVLIYYRQPRRIQMAGVQDPYTGVAAPLEIISEFKDDINELLVDEAVKILSGDIEAGNQMQREAQSVESNN